MQHYHPADRRARSALFALCAWAVAALGLVVAEMGRLGILNRIATGAAVSVHDTILSDNLVTAAAWAEAAAFIVTAAAFLAWLHRITENDHALGVFGARSSTALAAASLVLFMLSGAVRYAAALVYEPVNPVNGLVSSSIFEVGSIVLAGIAAALAVIMIVELTRRQTARAEFARASSTSIVPSPPPVALAGAAHANLHLPVSPGEV